MAKSVNPSDKELIELGKKVQAVFETGYVSRSRSLSNAFLKGLAGGFGAFLGGTILIALLIWFLGLFEDVPLIARFVDAISRTLEQ